MPSSVTAVLPCFLGCPALLQGPSCCDLPLTSPGGHLPTVNSSPHPDCPPILTLQLPAIASTRGPASLSGVWLTLRGFAMQISPHSDHHRSAASLSKGLRCLCSVPNYCSNEGSHPCFPVPPPLGSQVSLTLPLFSLPPSPSQVLCGPIDSFLVVRDAASSQLALCQILCI